MNILLYRKGILLFGALAVVNICHAQNELPVDEIEVIKHFDARLIETQKVPLTPRLPEPDTTVYRYQYQVTVTNPEIVYQPPQIRPLGLRPEAQEPGYRGLLRAGYGVPNQVYGDLSYLLIDRDPLQILIKGHHHQANHKKTDLQKFSDSGGEISGNYNLSPALNISGQLGYDYDRIHFYGLRENDNFPYVDEQRNYKLFTAQFGIANTEPVVADINYRATLDFYNLKDDLAAKETGVRLNLRGDKVVARTHLIALDLIADLSTLNDSEQKQDLDNLFVKPTFAFRQRNFNITGGVNLALHAKETDVFPILDATFRIVGNKIMAFAQVDGGLNKNNFFTLSRYNPFIHQRIHDIRNTVHRDYFIGVKGQVGKLEYSGRAGYSSVKNLALFEPDRFDYRKFQPLYDDGNIVRIEGEVKARPMSRLEVGASVSKLFYDLDVQEKAWQLPSLQGSIFSAFYSTDKKLRVRADLFIESGAPFLDRNDESDNLKGLFDLSLGADYFVTKNIGAFIQANNLFGNKHQRWEGYTVYGVNGVIGVMVRI